MDHKIDRFAQAILPAALLLVSCGCTAATALVHDGLDVSESGQLSPGDGLVLVVGCTAEDRRGFVSSFVLTGVLYAPGIDPTVVTVSGMARGPQHPVPGAMLPVRVFPSGQIEFDWSRVEAYPERTRAREEAAAWLSLPALPERTAPTLATDLQGIRVVARVEGVDLTVESENECLNSLREAIAGLGWEVVEHASPHDVEITEMCVPDYIGGHDGLLQLVPGAGYRIVAHDGEDVLVSYEATSQRMRCDPLVDGSQPQLDRASRSEYCLTKWRRYRRTRFVHMLLDSEAFTSHVTQTR